MSESFVHYIDHKQLRSRLIALPRRTKRALLLVADGLMIPACLWLAVALKYDDLSGGPQRFIWFYAGATIISVLVFLKLGLYRSITRFIGFQILWAILGGGIASSLFVWLIGQALAPQLVSGSVAIIYGLNVLAWVLATRLVARWILSLHGPAQQPVVIYGAGEAGAQLAIALAAGSKMYPVAYVDEKTASHGATIGGVRIVSPSNLPAIIQEHAVANVLLAIPGASRRRRAEIIRQMVDFGVHVQTIPDLNDILSGRATLTDLRDISIEDLLGRDPVTPQSRLLGVSIRGKCVMVTGAGGSIGSELCRQIIQEEPNQLIMFELSEIALYDIERELHSAVVNKALKVKLVALLGNAQHRAHILEIMKIYGVQTVYHAAAYKHVPIVEQNFVEGINNNVLATWNTAEAAIEAGVETFVLVSTDKAVHPANIMGASKRFAEIVLQALQMRQQTTCMCMVRFGNVLGSSGSVVPLFSKQIRIGGPVTVTHPEVRRYFMTIPEAASLVLQAGSMAKGGEVFVLDMGQPVKIDDLARRMIALSGLTVRSEEFPDGDIAIEYTGLRPGEKLYEELLIGENVSGTEHPMIMRAFERAPSWLEVQQLLSEMRKALEQFDCDRIRDVLVSAVPEFHPADRMHDLMWSELHEKVTAPPMSGRRSAARTVVPLRTHPQSQS